MVAFLAERMRSSLQKCLILAKAVLLRCKKIMQHSSERSDAQIKRIIRKSTMIQKEG